MKAIRCHQFGSVSDLRWEEIPLPIPSTGEIRIRSKYIGVNYPDLLLVKGLYQRKPQTPFIPGAEVAGVVDAVGQDVQAFKVGEQVVAKQLQGAYAEFISVPASACYHLPSSISPQKAAACLVTYGTSLHALQDRAILQPGETLLVLGAAGGVGLAAIDIAKTVGAHVIAVASSEEKLEICRRYGADTTINYLQSDLREKVKEELAGRSLDVVLDPVGHVYAEPMIRSLGFGGRYLVVGFAGGSIPQIPLNIPLLKSCAIVGVFYGRFLQERPLEGRANHEKLITWLADGKINPYIQKTFPLSHAPDALQWLDDRRAIGKVVLSTAE